MCSDTCMSSTMEFSTESRVERAVGEELEIVPTLP